MMIHTLKLLFVLSFLLICGCTTRETVKSGLPATAPLFREIQQMDSLLSEAFNAHDVSRLMSLFARDVEFYHDSGGLQHYDEVASGFIEL
jgi:hypothetical protein